MWLYPGCLPEEVFQACPAGRRHKRQHKTRWRNDISLLARKCLRVSPDKLEEATGLEASRHLRWDSCPHDPKLDKDVEDGWMNICNMFSPVSFCFFNPALIAEGLETLSPVWEDLKRHFKQTKSCEKPSRSRGYKGCSRFFPLKHWFSPSWKGQKTNTFSPTEFVMSLLFFGCLYLFVVVFFSEQECSCKQMYVHVCDMIEIMPEAFLRITEMGLNCFFLSNQNVFI